MNIFYRWIFLIVWKNEIFPVICFHKYARKATQTSCRTSGLAWACLPAGSTWGPADARGHRAVATTATPSGSPSSRPADSATPSAAPESLPACPGPWLLLPLSQVRAREWKENTVLRKKRNCLLHLTQNKFSVNSLFHSLKVFYCWNIVKTKSSLSLNLWIKTLVPSDRISFY